MKSVLRLFVLLAVFTVGFFVSDSVHAAAVSCPVADNGVGDSDGLANGTITINASDTWDTTGYAALGDYWDCTGVDIVITNNAVLTWEGDTTNGYYPYLKTDNLQIDSGSSISADGEGCTGHATNGNGYAVDTATNICTESEDGSGNGASTSTGGSGGGYGGEGGITVGAGTKLGGVRIGSTAISLPLFGSSGGGAGSGFAGGTGGGVIRIEVSNTLTLNGDITADGAQGGTDGSSRNGGGGSGGTVYIETTDLAGSTGTISADGADGQNGSHASRDGAGGGGGRVLVSYETSTLTVSDSNSTVDGGGNEGGAGGIGTEGTILVINSTTDTATFFGEFAHTNDDSTVYDTASNWVFDSSSTQVCEDGVATPDLGKQSSGNVTSLTLDGSLSCSASSLTDFNVYADTTLSVATGFSFTITTIGANTTWSIPNNQTWTNMTMSLPVEGRFIIDDSISIELAGTTSIQGNVYWENLTGATIGASAEINASELGCRGVKTSSTTVNSYADDGTFTCAAGTTGYAVGYGGGSGRKAGGGGGYGGAGGRGSAAHASGTGGSTHGSESAPLRFGSAGGQGGESTTGQPGGYGGGLIYIQLASGTFSHEGALMANGGNGPDASGYTYARATGGGSGGSIYLDIAGTYDGSTGTLSAAGGDGSDYTALSTYGGGGGGGRVAVSYVTDTSSTLSTFSAATVATGGTGPGSAVDGSDGTFYSATPGPSMSVAITADADADGQIDTIVVTFSADIDGGTVAGSDFSVDGYTVSSASRTDTSEVTIVLTESGTPDTDALPTVTIQSDIDGASGGTTSSGVQASTDGAAPVPTFGAYKDVNGDGTVDRIDITYSENIAYDECEAGDYTIGGADAGTIVVSSCANSGDDLQLTISNATSNDTNLALTLAYTAANGTADSLDDAAGNASGDFPATALADAASPVALSSSYTDADSNGQVDRIDVVFTEDIAVDECEAGDYTIGGADAGSISVNACAPSGSTMQFGINNAPGGDTNLALQISYTAANGTASSLDDSSGSPVADFGPLTPTDAARPLLGGIAIQDTNQDGLIDQLIIDFSEDIDTDDGAAPVLADFGTITLPDGNTVSSATITDPAGSSAFITLSNVVGQVTPNTGAGSTGIDGITNEWSDGTNLTDNPDENEGIIDDAFPRLRTDGSNAPAYQDSNTDGTIDRVKLVFTEAVTITYSDGDWNLMPNDLPSIDVSGVSSGNGTNTIYLTASAQSNTTGVGGGTEPQISFMPSSGSISDGTNSMGGIPNTTLTDDAAPALRTDGANAPTYLDNNNDGTIDRVQLTFTEAATLTYNDGDWTATANDLTSFDVGAYLSGNGTTQILLSASAATNLTGVSGGTEPTLAFSPSTGSIVDGNGASLSSISATSLADGADPVTTAYVYKDVNGDATVDRMDVTFTEVITVNECELADYSLTGSDSSGLSYSACATDAADLQLTISGAPSNDTNLVLEFAYNAANSTANSLDDASGNPVATISTQTATDGARPVLVSFSYEDDDNDGQIDQVTAVFSEDVTVTYVDSDWTATANDLTGFDVTGYSSGNGSANIVLSATADPGQTGVSGGTEPTIGFTPTSGSVSDGTVEATTISATSVADAAAMTVVSSAYKDINTDGQVDRLDITFSEAPSLGECESGDYGFTGTDAGSIAVSACVVSSADLRLTLNNAPASDTNLSFQWSYTAANGTADSIEDGSATAAPDYTNQTPIDAAAPLRLSQSYKDVNADGTVDRFDLTFTEEITYDECEAGDYTIGGVDAAGLSISSCATSGADLRLSVSGASANDTYLTLTLAYTAANGTANSLDDAAGNVVGNLSGASLSDEALPVVTTLNYSDGNNDGTVDAFNLSFSETISLDECETEDWVIGGTDAGSLAVVDVTGCSVSGSDIDFTISGSSSNTTALDLTFSYADNGTAGSFNDEGGVNMGGLSFSSLNDNAAPLKLSQTYLDTNNDGQIDRMDVAYTEEMTVATCEVNDHIFGGADAGSIAITGCVVSGTDVQYALNNAPANDTNLTLTYEYDKDADTANSLQDGSGNVLADYVAASVSDGAAPILRTDGSNAPTYVDADYDGQVDGVVLTFTENTTITYSDGDWSVTANDLTGMDVSAVASGNGTTSITLTASANAGITGVDAGTEPTIGYTNTTGSIVDGSANERTSISTATFEDGAAPAAVSQNYKDTNNDGQIDRIDVTFSELIEQNECESADFSFGSTDAGSIAVASCAISSNDLRLTISNAPAQDTNLDLTWSYDASNGTANSLDDSDGNATGDQTGKTLADAAAPLLISSSPADSATAVANDADIVLTFTEPMDTGSVTYTYTNYTGGATGVWSSGNSVLTLTPDGTYDSESSITFEITAADDPTGNSMTNTVSTHPFSFTVVAYSSGGSTGSLYVERAGQYTSIKIYDPSDLTTPLTTVTPGQSVSIVWVHNGNITTTELYYQTEEMNTSSTLIDLVTDGGTQSDWVIPTTTAIGQDLTVTAVNAQKVSYNASTTVTVGEEEKEPEEKEEEEEELPTNGTIRTDDSPGVYSTFADGTRRVFMNSQTYFTWYEDFDGVETVEVPVMSDYLLTGVMLPKAGTVLVKIQSIPNVYYLEENPEDPYQPILRWIPDEETATSLFGKDWALSVIDIEPTFFTKFATSDDPLSTFDVSWIDVDMLRTREELAQ